ncbi:MAG TPA: MarC family protein [Bryobacteraceae bacterium]|jgi:multiple antibiotic resistance protein|nr:MarC family protein [Bryobacteraceae bacterium]
MPPLLQFSLVTFTSIFALVDPIAAVPTFLVMTTHDTGRRRYMAARASWTCFLVLAIFAVAGPVIFEMFGITLPAFRIAGGVILGLIGLDMLRARRSPTKETPGEAVEGAEKEDVGITPLGVPMLAGPGAMSSVTVLMAQNADWTHRGIVLAAVATASVASFLLLAAADRVGSYLHETGIRILARLMGLLLTAVAVQFILDGLRDVGVVR